jgi:hypothetical protein
LILALLPAQREALITAFRSAFSLPPGNATIADRITEQRHQRWIQAYLARLGGEPHPGQATSDKTV